MLTARFGRLKLELRPRCANAGYCNGLSPASAFASAGEVRAVDPAVNDVRYEPTDCGHHHHFLCECEEAFEIHGCAEGISEMGRLDLRFKIMKLRFMDNATNVVRRSETGVAGIGRMKHKIVF